MTLEILQKEMIQAMKDGNKFRKDALSMLIGNIKKFAIDNGRKDSIDESVVETVLLKEIKTVKEQIATCPVTRSHLLVEYTIKLNTLEEFAPAMISQEEIEKVVIDICEKEGIAIEVQNRGRIMRAARGLGLKIDGADLNIVVTRLLQ